MDKVVYPVAIYNKFYDLEDNVKTLTPIIKELSVNNFPFNSFVSFINNENYKVAINVELLDKNLYIEWTKPNGNYIKVLLEIQINGSEKYKYILTQNNFLFIDRIIYPNDNINIKVSFITDIEFLKNTCNKDFYYAPILNCSDYQYFYKIVDYIKSYTTNVKNITLTYINDNIQYSIYKERDILPPNLNIDIQDIRTEDTFLDISFFTDSKNIFVYLRNHYNFTIAYNDTSDTKQTKIVNVNGNIYKLPASNYYLSISIDGNFYKLNTFFVKQEISKIIDFDYQNFVPENFREESVFKDFTKALGDIIIANDINYPKEISKYNWLYDFPNLPDDLKSVFKLDEIFMLQPILDIKGTQSDLDVLFKYFGIQAEAVKIPWPGEFIPFRNEDVKYYITQDGHKKLYPSGQNEVEKILIYDDKYYTLWCQIIIKLFFDIDNYPYSIIDFRFDTNIQLLKRILQERLLLCVNVKDWWYIVTTLDEYNQKLDEKIDVTIEDHEHDKVFHYIPVNDIGIKIGQEKSYYLNGHEIRINDFGIFEPEFDILFMKEFFDEFDIYGLLDEKIEQNTNLRARYQQREEIFIENNIILIEEYKQELNEDFIINYPFEDEYIKYIKNTSNEKIYPYSNQVIIGEIYTEENDYIIERKLNIISRNDLLITNDGIYDTIYNIEIPVKIKDNNYYAYYKLEINGTKKLLEYSTI